MKKHFMATHTWTSNEARDKVIEMNSGMTEEEFFSGLKTEKAETLQHWMGKDDFFFCHWYAESEDAIICLLYTSPSPRDGRISRMPSSA